MHTHMHRHEAFFPLSWAVECSPSVVTNTQGHSPSALSSATPSISLSVFEPEGKLAARTRTYESTKIGLKLVP